MRLLSLQSIMGWFAHPIFKNGDYPEVVKQQVADKSALQGYEKFPCVLYHDNAPVHKARFCILYKVFKSNVKRF